MIKILFFTTTLSAGGAEKVLCNLVNNMDKTKFDITVQTIDKADASRFLADGIRYKSINNAKTPIGKKLFNIWLRIISELKLTYRLYIKDDYDIEAAYLEFGPTKMLAGSTNKKAVKLAWVHCDPLKNDGFISNNDKVKKQYSPFDKIICVSTDVRKGFQSLFGYKEKTEVLYNVIDEDEIYLKCDSVTIDHSDSKYDLLAIGRLTSPKAFDKLIKDCRSLADDGIDFHLTILGEGPDRKMLEELIITLGLEKYITLKGFVENPYPYINSSDIVVCSSKYEGISTALTEALLLGKPVVTTPCAGMKELLGDSEYGLIAEDSEDGLYNALKSVMTDEKLFKYYSEKAGIRSDAFKKKKILALTEELFEKSVKEKKND